MVRTSPVQCGSRCNQRNLINDALRLRQHTNTLPLYAGAGKTTLVSMMAQQLAPTQGSIRVWGIDIAGSVGDPGSRLVAICPQHDPLWPELTVTEHIALYAKIKASATSSYADQQHECAALLADVGLATKSDQLSGALSGV